ncbi:TPA: helix-turn-helix domain-containing protein [Klebsiella quasipneumoniae subsp. quasipneumoniae]|nr:helix-turn-helix domain-containing protein [Klebsiella aerogenes]HCI6421256.1 helix-turn-helix domain-containing protein [Klebsiella quasipneumoniae subsp. similipneumoniae]HCI6737376.1 helix-turn-helix domain-containing protein [Klebsiella quasipneumoniae subsp. quasipneumoniae]
MNPHIAKAIEIAGSQTKLAQLVGVSQVSVCRWLNEKKKVSPERVHALSDATGNAIKPHQIRPDLPMLFPHPEA